MTASYRLNSALKHLMLLLLLAMPLRALATPCMDPDHLGPDHYIHPSQIDLIGVLGPPPAPGSPLDQTDLQAVIESQKDRTQAEIDSAKAGACYSIFAFADVMGAGFEAGKLPFTVAFFQRVFDDGMHGAAVPKDYYDRPRPFVADPGLTPLIAKPTSASYPSGHATFAYMTAILLAEMVPEKAPAIFARAAAFAHNRVVAGVHYPSDLIAGRVSAAVMDNVLLHDPAFEVDLAKSRNELRLALGLPAESGKPPGGGLGE